MGTTARVAPDRRWFGNTRVIDQDHMHKFREVRLAPNSSVSFGVVVVFFSPWRLCPFPLSTGIAAESIRSLQCGVTNS